MSKLKSLMFLLFVICMILMLAIGCSSEDKSSSNGSSSEEAKKSENDEQIVLRLSTLFPESHCTNQYLHYPIAEEIEKETNDKVKIKMYPGATLGEGAAHYDMAVEGVAEITQGIQGFTPGRFPLTSVVELPFLFPTDMSAETCNEIVWKLFQNVPELREEYEDVKVLSIFVNEPGHIYTRNKLIKTLDDFDGMKIRAPMDTASSMLKALGASPVTMPTGDLYLSLERGVVDGTLFNTANMSDWKLWEVVDYYTEAGFYNLAWFAVMNKKTWESLPEDVQDVIEEKYELNAGKEVGKGFDKDYNKNIEIAKEEGVEIYELPKEERNKWKDKVEVVHEQWVQKMEDKGLPGRKVLNEIKRLIEEQK